MVASDVLRRLTAAGIRLSAAGEQLFAEPRAALTDDLRVAIRAHKPALLTALLTPCPDDLRPRIWAMAAQWGYSPDELLYALRQAAARPDEWRLLLTDDEEWRASH